MSMGREIEPVHAFGIEDYNPYRGGQTRPEMPPLSNWVDTIGEIECESNDENYKEASILARDLRHDIDRFSFFEIIDHMDKCEEVITNMSKGLQDIWIEIDRLGDIEDAKPDDLRHALEAIMESVNHAQADGIRGDKVKSMVFGHARTFMNNFPYLSLLTFEYSPSHSLYRAESYVEGEVLRYRLIGGGLVVSNNNGTLTLDLNLSHQPRVTFSSLTKEAVSYTMKELEAIFENPWSPTEEERNLMKMMYPSHHSDILDLMLAQNAKRNPI